MDQQAEMVVQESKKSERKKNKSVSPKRDVPGADLFIKNYNATDKANTCNPIKYMQYVLCVFFP